MIAGVATGTGVESTARQAYEAGLNVTLATDAMDISYAGQNLVKGVVLLLAVITDSFLNPRNEETAQQGDI